MRRVARGVVALAITMLVVPAAEAQVVPVEDRGRGLVYRGLGRGPAGGPCGSLYEMRADGVLVGCTHGPDPAPEGVDVRERRHPEAVSAESLQATSSSSPICHGDGQTGYRIQLIYARASDMPDRYAQYVNSFRLWAAQMDDIFSLSAEDTGGTRHIRFVHDAACVPTIERVVLPPNGDDTLTLTKRELAAQGYSRVDRKYLVWTDANIYCGIADILIDDFGGEDNIHNGSGRAPGMVARIDNGCWGQTLPSGLVEAHELVHVLGGVQPSAPHGTQNGHCTDEYDLMCYRDAPGVTVQYVCGTAYTHENRLDCNHDDYFHTRPPAGSYLATKWNTANSRFLVSNGTTSVTRASGEPGGSVTVSGRGATPWVSYRAKMATSSAGCPTTSLVLGGTVLADSSGVIPAVSRTIPITVTSGRRFICFASVDDPANDFTSPTPFTVF
ncbi:MAG: hypothetical protein M3144_00110 [Actinomycetota bacterium]|nr:hypothetical protein [Actinomycetota bacterium]